MDVYQVSSNNFPGVKNGSAQGAQSWENSHLEHFKKYSCPKL